MAQAAKVMGNEELEKKFEDSLTKVKRDIVAAQSLYLQKHPFRPPEDRALRINGSGHESAWNFCIKVKGAFQGGAEDMGALNSTNELTIIPLGKAVQPKQ